ncbi:MAG: TonB-dependent receptor [Spongiibacteraceae bacterium]
MIKDKQKKAGLWGRLAALLAVLTPVAHADVDGTSGRSTGRIEEVVVTAQKREQNLQDTPISITAYTKSDIENMDITDVHSISTGTPNLYINKAQGDSTSAVMSMRGVSQPNPTNLSNEGTVGLYLDGVYIGKGTAAIFDLADIERIEVLRGPQGTLYGKNTIGGAVSIISAKPSGEFGGDLKLGFGTDNLIYSKVNIDLPAFGEMGVGIGALKSKLSLVTRNRDGLVDNSTLDYSPIARPLAGDGDFGEQDIKSGRVALQLDVTDALVFDYSFDKTRVRNTTPLFQLLNLSSSSIFNPDASAAGFNLYSYLQSDYPDEGSTDIGNRDYADIEGHAFTVSWQASDDISLKSITAKRKFNTDAVSDYDGSNLSFYTVSRQVDYEQFSQEFQIIGQHENINWVAGYYHFSEEGTYYSPRIVFGEFGGNDTVYSFAGIDNKLDAVFGQLDWVPSFQPALTFSVGARYSEETKKAKRAYGDFDDELPADYIIPPTNLGKLDLDSNTSVMASVSWTVSDDITLYGKYSEGYRSGGYDSQTNDPAAFEKPYDSELLSAYEAGLKSRWLDNRVQFNMAAFFSQYDELQITVFDPAVASSFVENAGEAEISGVEFELLVMPTDNLTLSLGYGYIDPEYKRYDFFDAGSNQLTDISDVAKFTQAPERSFSAVLDYQLLRTRYGLFNLHLDYSKISNFNTQPHAAGKSPISTRVDGYGLLNMRLSLADIPLGGGYNQATVTLWGKNITDEEYVTTNIDFGDAYFKSGTYGDPITYGVEVSLNF